MTRKFWLNNQRFYVIAALLMLIWFGFLVFFYLKADEITRDPCGICSERMGDKVVCTLGGLIPASRTYYPNGTILETGQRVVTPETKPFKDINVSELNITFG